MKQKESHIYLGAAAVTIAAFLISLYVGKYNLTLGEIFQICTGAVHEGMARNVFFTLRLPRTIMALMAGFGLSMAGAVYQNIFKNPLAAPDLIGVANGAAAGAAFSIVCLHGGTILAAGSSFVGGITAVAAVVVLAGFVRQRTSAAYVLAGIAVKAAAEAFVMAMKYFADPDKQLSAIDYWAMGSFANITMDKLRVIFPVFLAGFIGIILLRWQITLLSLGDDEARMLGMRVNLVRCIVFGFSTLLVASTVCVTGIISFIGLVAPHIARMLLKKSDFGTCILSGLTGASIMMAADCFARSMAGSEVPISILTSVCGVPLLVYLLCKRGDWNGNGSVRD